MSVPITVVVRDAESFAASFDDAAFSESLFEGELESEEMCDEELDYQLRILDALEAFQNQLPAGTREAINDFSDRVFWSWREGKGRQTIDVPLESEGLDSSFGAETVRLLLSTLGRIDWQGVEGAFQPNGDFETVAEFREYFDDWSSILERAAAAGHAVFVFVYP